MTPVERAELLEMREEMRLFFRELRDDMARGFRDLSCKEEETRERVARMEGGIALIRWLGPAGVIAVITGLLLQTGTIQ